MTEELKCERLIRVDDGCDPQGRPLSHHERCNKPASEHLIQGMLTTAKAVLCNKHFKIEDKKAFISEKGYAKGQFDKKSGDPGQVRVRPAVEVK